MKKNLICNTRGSVNIFVILVLALGLFAFAAVVIDVGFIYSTRRQMVTASDAAALAGAKEMEKTLGSDSAYAVSSLKAKAIEIAKNTAIQNGAEGEPIVTIEKMNVKLADGSTDYRDVIKVKAVSDEKMIFFRFIDQFNMEVSGTAVATWGFVTKVTAGQLLPLYTTPELFIDSNNLHSGKMTFNDTLFSNQRGFIYLDPQWNGQNIINKAIEGVPTKITLGLDTLFEGKSGTSQSVINAVEERMKKAQALANPEDRRAYMYGLIPIAEFDSNQGNQTFFQISSFAVYEIIDVMTNTNKGSPEAILGPNYTRLGSSRTYTADDNNGADFEKGAIYGRFTGEVREIEVVIEQGDQQGNILTITSGARYSKLIQ
jgi:hypothetical protein